MNQTHAKTSGSNLVAAPMLELMGSRQFNSWLAEQFCRQAFNTNQTGKLFLVGLQPDGRRSTVERTFNRCLGLWAMGKLCG